MKNKKIEEDCVFCKIIHGEIPSYKIYEDRDFVAILDIVPVNPGHILLIPKKHFQLLEELPENLAKKLILVARKLIPKIKKTVNADAVNFSLNDGKIAGQLIPHVHFHIMPRFNKDGHKLFEGKPLKKEDAEKILKNFR
jgi:histidine triad (HIT) family protein